MWGGRTGSAQEVFGLIIFLKEFFKITFTYLLLLINNHGKVVLFIKLPKKRVSKTVSD